MGQGRAAHDEFFAGLVDAGYAARTLGMGVRQFIEAADKERLDYVRTTDGRYYDRRGVRQLAMKLAALTRDHERRELLRGAVRQLRDE